MTWTNCSTNDPNASACILGPNNFQSHVKFCYAFAPDSCLLSMEIDTVPPCVQCDAGHSSFPYCVKLKATCSSTNNQDWEAQLDDSDPNTPPLVKFNYRIKRDAVTFQVCCDIKDPSGYLYTYCCSGDMVYNP